MHRFAHLPAALALAGLIALGASVAPAANAAGSAPVKSTLGRVLVNAAGMTLYVFSEDKANKSSCTGGCAKYWPPALVPAGATAPTAVDGITGTFGTTARADGTTQLTFDGAPLYTWLKDKKPGQMTGQGVGGTWWTVVVGTTKAAASSTALVKTAPAKLMVTSKGMTLYIFTPDKTNKSNCTGGCAKYWPPLELAAGAAAPATMAGFGGKFATAKRADGSAQLTYDGAPLYTWLKDKKPGDVTGVGIEGTWWAVTA